MIALWNTHFLLSSLTLAVVTALSVYIGRALLSRRPTIYHGFLVFILVAFLVTLPLQFGTAFLQETKDTTPTPLKKSFTLAAQEEPNDVSRTYFPMGEFLKAKNFNELAEIDLPQSSRLFPENDCADELTTVAPMDCQDDKNDAFPDYFEKDTNDVQEHLAAVDLADEQDRDLSSTESLAVLAALSAKEKEKTRLNHLSDFLAPFAHAPWLAFIHLLGMTIALAVEILRLRKTQKIIRSATPITDPLTLKVWREVAGTASSRIQLCQSPHVHSPVCWGIFKPTIIVPDLVIKNEHKAPFKWALRHELVHLKRGDPRTTLFQSVLRILFWFHPATWFFNSELNRLREMSCDHTVVGSQGSRKSYALALLEYAKQNNNKSRLSPLSPTAPALIPWSGSMSQLERRIKMLAQTESTTIRPLRLLQVLGAAFVAVCVFGGQVALAAHMPIPQSTDTPATITFDDVTLSETTSPPAPKRPPVPEVDFTAAPGGSPAIIDFTDAPIAIDFVTGNKKASAGATSKFEIGVILKAFDAKLAKNLGMPKGTGLIITKIVKNSHAARSGLKVNDPIVKIDGEYASMKQIRAAKKRSGGKSPIKFLVMRGASIKTIVVRFDNKTRVRISPKAIINFSEEEIVEEPEPEIIELELIEEEPEAGVRPPSLRGRVAPTPRNRRAARSSRVRSRTPVRAGTQRRRDGTVGTIIDGTVGPRASNRSNVERQINNLNRRIDRLTEAMERQSRLIDRLMKSNTRRVSPRRTRSSKPTGMDTRMTKERKIVFRQAELAVQEARKIHAADRQILETQSLRNMEMARYEARLSEHTQRLARANVNLSQVENMLAQLTSQDLQLAQRELEMKNLVDLQAKKAALTKNHAERAALQAHLQEAYDSIVRSRDHKDRLSAEKRALISEYEAKISAMESESVVLRNRLRAKKAARKGKTVEIFEDVLPKKRNR